MYIDHNAELALPSVIIDMPELQRMAARKKALHGMLYTLAALTFVALGGLIYLELTMRPREVVEAETLEVKDESAGSLKLTVKLAPQQVAGAVVEVDGEVISGNPPYVYLSPSEEYHSIKITAPGYEVMSKDVQVTASEVMTFALISKDAAVVADNTVDANDEDGEEMVGDDVLSESDFDANSDDLIEEIVDDAPVVGKKGGDRKRGKGAGRKNSGRRKSEGGGRGKSEGKSQIRAVSVAFGPTGNAAANAGGAPTPSAAGSGSAPASASAPASTAPAATPGRMTTVPAQPLGNGPQPGAATPGVAASAPAPAAAAKASLIVNAPLGVTSRVRVSVDGKMRGYLPVLLKVDPGLHELTFMTEGRRTFQMVKLNPGQIVRIIPNL